MATWAQRDNRVELKTRLGTFWAEMPDGWRLDDCHPAALAVAEWLLFHNIPALQEECISLEALKQLPYRARPPHSKTILCYSAGADSTAALMLLPRETTIPVYCRRPYDSYRRSDGIPIKLATFAPIQRCLDKVGGVVQVPSVLETMGPAAGLRHGFHDGYGYAVMACLLADHYGAGTVAFGSVMEQVFMGAGNNYTDIIKMASSRWQMCRQLFRVAGLDFALPTGGCSEVLTERTARSGPYGEVIVSCPTADASNRPCGTCFKCFRKLRIAGTSAPEPDKNVVAVLKKRPLKSATSVVYACQKAGWWKVASLAEYRDVDLGFLERYHGYAVDYLLSVELASHVHNRMAELGVQSMNPEEEAKLRRIGQTFWPEAFSRTRAGLPDL